MFSLVFTVGYGLWCAIQYMPLYEPNFFNPLQRGLDNWIPTIVGIVGNSFQRFLHTGQYIEQLKQDIVNGMAQTTCDSSWLCTAGLPNQYKLPGKIQKRTMVRD